MKKIFFRIIILAVVILPFELNAESGYSECMTDIYFGNGVWNTYQQARKANEEIRKKLIAKGTITSGEIGKRYDFRIAYNWHGMYKNDTGHDEQFQKFFDVAETFVQLRDAGQLKDTTLFKLLTYFSLEDETPSDFDQKVKAYIALAEITRLSNIAEMQSDYQQYSFDKGHRVLLVSHSQGNLWANDMVKLFKPWQKNYFKNVAVAVPADHLEADGRYTTLFCDIVMALIPNSLESNVGCTILPHVEEISGHEFMGSYLKNPTSENKIFGDIKFYLEKLDEISSQWETDEEFDENTKDYRITVKHKFDSEVSLGNTKVYPFVPSKKLYTVDDKYIKASCGGTKILDGETDTWDNQQDNEFYYLEGTGETITGEETCDDPSDWRIIGNNDLEVGSKEYRITVENIHTGDQVIDVYPFSINGTVYRLETAEWVMATCGGTEILDSETDSWDNQQDNEFYYLEGTGEIIKEEITCGNFVVTDGSYNSTDNFNQICKNIYGANFRQADWNDFLNYSGSNTELVECLNLEQKRHSWVTKDGVGIWSGNRVYFLSYYNHNVPSYYLVHADIDNDFFVLGSWYSTFHLACFQEN